MKKKLFIKKLLALAALPCMACVLAPTIASCSLKIQIREEITKVKYVYNGSELITQNLNYNKEGSTITISIDPSTYSTQDVKVYINATINETLCTDIKLIADRTKLFLSVEAENGEYAENYNYVETKWELKQDAGGIYIYIPTWTVPVSMQAPTYKRLVEFRVFPYDDSSDNYWISSLQIEFEVL